MKVVIGCCLKDCPNKFPERSEIIWRLSIGGFLSANGARDDKGNLFSHIFKKRTISDRDNEIKRYLPEAVIERN